MSIKNSYYPVIFLVVDYTLVRTQALVTHERYSDLFLLDFTGQ